MNWFLKTSQGSPNISITEWQRSMRYQLYELVAFSERKPSDNPYTEEHVEEDIARLSVETNENMLKISQIVQEAISRIPDWNGSGISIEARTYDKDNDINAETDAEVQVGVQSAWGGVASFTFFLSGERGINIDDILEAGDKDFFTENNTQSDYFSLVQELRSPGARTQQGQTLTLFTARPVKDRPIFEGATQIPSNIFLTNDPERAVGIALDLGSRGRRDVWQVRINKNSLILTNDTPTVKDYQAVGQGQIPVEDMFLIMEGE